MRVLIAGGTGLIGTALANSFVIDRHDVAVLTRGVSEIRNGVSLVHWDGETTSGWAHEVEDADAIVNLAGAGIADQRWSDTRKREIVASRVNVGLAFVSALQAAKRLPTVFVQASAVGYYGVHSDDIVTEETPAGSDFLATTCVSWEASTQAVEALGIRRTIARTGVVFSMDGGALPQILLPFRLVVAGGRLGSGKQYVPWIHIDDEVRALRWLMETPTAQGIYNLSAPNPVTNAEMASTIGEIMARPSLIPTPAIALQIAMGERATLVLDGQRQMPERLLADGFSFKWPELGPSLRDLLNNKTLQLQQPPALG